LGSDNKDGAITIKQNANAHVRIYNDKTNNWFAFFPLDVVERIDGFKPCQILKESRDKKRMRKY